MKPKKTASFTLRLDADLLEQIEQLAEQQHRNRTGIITEALRRYVEISTQGEQEPAGEVQKLDQVIALLGTISGQLGAQAKPAPALKAERTAPAPQRETMQGDADGLIASMTERRASLEDIVAALNAAGYRTATGQEWTRSRCRDYRHKLKDLGRL
ncbi:ribbon-helix-helix protein, CopG family [Enterobacter sichuanensis]|uniref:Ribbon-helix-helix protein CopG domain-containing protein n=1 Tax=Enterobacter sichuanensis TaxID=2071710 RepID=A0A0F0ZS14_9ENTR|nr:ribbon-helix-helix protein, CopG family [Enterobacter sichuanensis]KJN12691.1 hypothetical protein SS37_25280 [Enterobacter sichuanensis]